MISLRLREMFVCYSGSDFCSIFHTQTRVFKSPDQAPPRSSEPAPNTLNLISSPQSTYSSSEHDPASSVTFVMFLRGLHAIPRLGSQPDDEPSSEGASIRVCVRKSLVLN